MRAPKIQTTGSGGVEVRCYNYGNLFKLERLGIRVH